MAKRFDRTPKPDLDQDKIQVWKSRDSRWQTWATRDGDGWLVTATCLESRRVKVGTVLRTWFTGFWPEVHEEIGQRFRDIDDGVIVVGEK